MQHLVFSTHDSHPPTETAIVDAGLGESNEAAAPLHEVQAISCFVRTEGGQVAAVAYAMGFLRRRRRAA